MTGDAIRRRRRSLGLSQAQLGDLAGVSRDTIRRLEAEEGEPHPANARAIAEQLQITAGQLLGYDDTPPAALVQPYGASA